MGVALPRGDGDPMEQEVGEDIDESARLARSLGVRGLLLRLLLLLLLFSRMVEVNNWGNCSAVAAATTPLRVFLFSLLVSGLLLALPLTALVPSPKRLLRCILAAT